ncbi:MAG: hypothetical protein JST16_12935 [Bdellovibrionales bacterium]|nr:hypothetical protein [Bdellovibrionales bacterium]
MESHKLVRLLSIALAASLGACTAKKSSEPVNISFQIKAFGSDAKSTPAGLNTVKRGLIDSTGANIALRDDYCYAISMIGPGLMQQYPQPDTASTVCSATQERFPGLGTTFGLMDKGKDYEFVIQPGDARQFALIAFKKSDLGLTGACDVKKLEIVGQSPSGSNGTDAKMYLNGVLVSNRSEPIFIAKSPTIDVKGGQDLVVPLTLSSGGVNGVEYGCGEHGGSNGGGGSSFYMFPYDDANGVVTLGANPAYIRVNCPSGVTGVNIHMPASMPGLTAPDMDRNATCVNGSATFNNVNLGAPVVAVQYPNFIVSPQNANLISSLSKSYTLVYKPGASYQYLMDNSMTPYTAIGSTSAKFLGQLRSGSDWQSANRKLAYMVGVTTTAVNVAFGNANNLVWSNTGSTDFSLSSYTGSDLPYVMPDLSGNMRFAALGTPTGYYWKFFDLVGMFSSPSASYTNIGGAVDDGAARGSSDTTWKYNAYEGDFIASAKPYSTGGSVYLETRTNFYDGGNATNFGSVTTQSVGPLQLPLASVSTPSGMQMTSWSVFSSSTPGAPIYLSFTAQENSSGIYTQAGVIKCPSRSACVASAAPQWRAGVTTGTPGGAWYGPSDLVRAPGASKFVTIYVPSCSGSPTVSTQVFSADDVAGTNGAIQTSMTPATGNFYPPWPISTSTCSTLGVGEVKFLKALNPDLSANDNSDKMYDLVAGGSDASGYGVLYRSPDAGLNWYLVYKTANPGVIADAVPLEQRYFYTPDGTMRPWATFGALEYVGGTMKVLLQNSSGF